MQQKVNKNGPFYSLFFLFNFVAFGCISLVSKDGNIYVLTRYFSFYLCLFAYLHILRNFVLKHHLAKEIKFKVVPYMYTTRTTDIQRELIFNNSKFLGFGRQIGLKFYDAFGAFLAKL